ncbi:hypothetical protein DSM104443_03597 [Usitatibacter rugosus]|uniref:Putative zinc-finger domain-containing protein n=1 Tax=Usitatibacter rugosus TaxID=2732067 RepID=A0A6M4GZ29_9PROT|nr:zf-HC2 domain-containing protein [Usitatibacter rugosus]QJR12511.1 hypothetical protein DSM104443_03597 [Usitatibacter rugosus]
MAEDLNCREAVRLMSLALERSLSPDESTALDVHLAECLDCTNFQVQVRFIHRAAGRFRGDA